MRKTPKEADEQISTKGPAVGEDGLVSIIMNVGVSSDDFSAQKDEELRCSPEIADRLVSRGDARPAS